MESRKAFMTIMAAIIAAQAGMSIASAYVSYDVIVVRGDVPTDYIIASIYSGTEKVPLVLVNPEMVQEQIRNELMGYRERGRQLLLIIGGENAISAGIENQFKDMGFIVNRLWDWNRYGTAARVAIDLWGESEEVVVANGEDFSGFLVAQEIAMQKGVPILFMANTTIPDQTRSAIRDLGVKSAVLVSSEKGAKEALQSLGINVESVETMPLRPSQADEEESGFDITVIVLVCALAAALIFAETIRRKGGKAPMFVMSEDEERIIEILKANGKTEQNKLASLTGYSKPRISRLLKRLEERKIIEREKFKKTLRIKLNPKIS